MKIARPIAILLAAAWMAPVAAYAAASNQSAVPANANETATITVPADRHGVSNRSSAHPIDDSVITTKIKSRFLKDKEIRTDNIEIKTTNGEVELFGTARTRAKARHAVDVARQVQGVRSVKSDIKVDADNTARVREVRPDGDRVADTRSPNRDRVADSRRSDQPVDDTWITTKVKSKLVQDKSVRAANIHVKTVNGEVELTGTARSRSEAARAASLARNVKGVRTVRNDLEVAPSQVGTTRDTRGDREIVADRPRSDQPVDDSWITTKVKAKMVEDKRVHASTISVKTVNGVVELTGTAKSMDESSRAAALARSIKGVQSVNNNISVN